MKLLGVMHTGLACPAHFPKVSRWEPDKHRPRVERAGRLFYTAWRLAFCVKSGGEK